MISSTATQLCAREAGYARCGLPRLTTTTTTTSSTLSSSHSDNGNANVEIINPSSTEADGGGTTTVAAVEEGTCLPTDGLHLLHLPQASLSRVLGSAETTHPSASSFNSHLPNGKHKHCVVGNCDGVKHSSHSFGGIKIKKFSPKASSIQRSYWPQAKIKMLLTTVLLLLSVVCSVF
jgi:hypothetical protein